MDISPVKEQPVSICQQTISEQQVSQAFASKNANNSINVNILVTVPWIDFQRSSRSPAEKGVKSEVLNLYLYLFYLPHDYNKYKEMPKKI